MGGVTNGDVGAAAFDFISPHDHLEAKKSWFFFQDEYVALGTGIEGEEDQPVVTTINQSWLDGEVVADTGSESSVLPKGAHDLSDARAVWHHDIGYVFPKKTQVHVSNQIQTGSWFEINKQFDSSKEEISKEVFKLWLPHGERPEDAGYAYMVVPSISQQRMPTSLEDRNVEILANTPEMQAVQHGGLNITQAAFYQPGTLQVADGLRVAADTPCMLMIEMNDGSIARITVSDPSRKLGIMRFSVTTKVEKETENFDAQWDPDDEVTEITVELPRGKYAGESVSLSL